MTETPLIPSARRGACRGLAGLLLLLLLIAWPRPGVLHAAAPPPSVERVQELLRGWRPAEAEEVLAALEQQGLSRAALAPALATVRFYQGEYAQALTLLEGTGDSDLKRSIEAAAQLARGMREVVTLDGFWRIRVHPGPDEILIPPMLELLPRIREANGRVFDAFPPTPTVVEVYGSLEELGQATGLTLQQLEDSGTIAICKFNRIMITSPRATLKGYSWQTTLSHEYLHLLINYRSFQRIPIWLHEGLARYNESWPFEQRPQELDPDTEALLLQALTDNQLITFDEMSPSMALLPTQRHTELAFAEVLTAIELLYRKLGQAGMLRVIDRLARAEFEDARDAFAAELSMPWAKFERIWKDDLRQRKPRPIAGKVVVPRIQFKKAERDPFQQELDEVDRKARDFAYLGQLLRGQSRHRAALLEYRKAATLNQGISPVIQNWIAATALEVGQPREVLAALAGIRERHPGYYPTYLHEGLALAALRDDATARSRFEQALTINPFDPRLHRELLRIYRQANHPHAERAATALRLLADGSAAAMDDLPEDRAR